LNIIKSNVFKRRIFMIRDANGAKLSPRQKAAETMLARLGAHANMDSSAIGDMTEREVALVNRQVEKLHSKMKKMLDKAHGEVESGSEEE
jgi:hypothetical protein